MSSRIRFVARISGRYYPGGHGRGTVLQWLARQGVIFTSRPSWNEVIRAMKKQGGEFVLLRERRGVSFTQSKYMRLMDLWGLGRRRVFSPVIQTSPTRRIIPMAEPPSPRPVSPLRDWINQHPFSRENATQQAAQMAPPRPTAPLDWVMPALAAAPQQAPRNLDLDTEAFWHDEEP